jgi:uncharacterized protein YdcH (DUF465 family)
MNFVFDAYYDHGQGTPMGNYDIAAADVKQFSVLCTRLYKLSNSVPGDWTGLNTKLAELNKTTDKITRACINNYNVYADIVAALLNERYDVEDELYEVLVAYGRNLTE